MAVVKPIFAKFYDFLTRLPQQSKSMLFPLSDLGLILIAYIGSAILMGQAVGLESVFMVSFFSTFTLLIAYLSNLYRIKLFSFDLVAIKTIIQLATLVFLIMSFLAFLGILDITVAQLFLFSTNFILLSAGFRAIVLHVLKFLESTSLDPTPIAVYGAGAAGLQLVAALKRSKEYKVVALVDDNPSLQGLLVSDLMILSPMVLPDLVSSKKVSKLLLAMPSLEDKMKKKIFEKFSSLNCEVQSLPSFSKLIATGNLVSAWGSISPEFFLSRDNVNLENSDSFEFYNAKVIMITGAGGSIGAEICTQLIAFEPKCIVCFEQSELALYQLENRIKKLFPKSKARIVFVLGSVTDANRVEQILREFKVETVFHAAAYKHVPIIESNEIEGIINNAYGTYVLCSSCLKFGVNEFVLISSDKAVRPTNIMGATKRLAELIIQGVNELEGSTKFSSVRFGNVLGSSGSVIPLFDSQIKSGGPVTVTDKRVTRFFMTLSEAVQLVLTAGTFGHGGDVFVLDMGKPIKIIDLARRMIKLSGNRVKVKGSSEDGIEIKEVGLRQGEKLYEELLIGNNTLPTPHKKILRAKEGMLSTEEFKKMIKELSYLKGNPSSYEPRSFISKWVKDYTPLL